MSISLTERRQIENEMIFRRTNEKVSDELIALDAMHDKDDRGLPISTSDLLLRFKCECADENCEMRIPMLLSEYQDIHTDRKSFIVMPGHQHDPIETVLKRTVEYNVVRKDSSVPEPVGGLNTTNVDNV
jgi:hypothetical protein